MLLFLKETDIYRAIISPALIITETNYFNNKVFEIFKFLLAI